MKIAYFGFDLFYDCLEYLSSDNEIIKIFTCKVDGEYEFNTKTYALASRKNIEITDEKITFKMIEDLERRGCELMISAGYYFKIPTSSKIKAINIHPSLLPEGRGPWPLPVTILKGLKTSGVSAHVITDAFDAGEIVHQIPISVSEKENLDTLTVKMQKTAVLLIEEIMDNFQYYWSNKKPQTLGSYWQEPSVKEMTFTADSDFDLSDKTVRAFYGYHCYFKTKLKTFCIKKAICVNNRKDVPTDCEIVVPIKNGYLCVLNLT